MGGFLGGDFNARIHFVRETDTDYVAHNSRTGYRIFKRNEKESSALFLGFCNMRHLRILNAQFSKPPEKLMTYKEKTNSSDFGPPFDAHRYAQLDFLVGLEKRVA